MKIKDETVKKLDNLLCKPLTVKGRGKKKSTNIEKQRQKEPVRG